MAGERAGVRGFDGADVGIADAARAKVAEDQDVLGRDGQRFRLGRQAADFLRADDQRVERLDVADDVRGVVAEAAAHHHPVARGEGFSAEH